MALGKKFSVDFQQAQEVSKDTQILVQTEGHPVEKGTVQQLGKALVMGGIVPSTKGNYPKMSVGFAENIVGDGSATPEVFSFRPTAGENRNTLNDGAARIQTLKGSSVVVNQIAKPRVSGSSNGVTWAIAEDGTITLKGTATAKVTFNPFTAPQISGHKYLMIGTPNGGGANKYYMNDQSTAYDYGAGVIYNSTTNSANWWFVFIIQNGVSVDFIFKPRLIDLTLMFGVGNEPTTVAEFYQRRPVGLDLAAYNEGEIVDGNYEAIKTTGFNQWDEQWEHGYWDEATGDRKGNANPSYIRNTNPIRVIGGAKYYLRNKSGQLNLFGYDANGKYIRKLDYGWGKYDMPIDIAYINFSAYLPSYQGGEVLINLSWDEYASMNGTYRSYKPFVRDLSWVAKYFPNGMRSAGNVADEIRFNSSTQKWEAVKRVGVRAYASGDENNNAVITDKVNTNYALPTPIVTEITENVNFDFDVSDYGTEELISDGASAPLSADIVYEPNVLATIKNLPNILARLTQMEAMVSAMAVATTNMNE